MKIKAIRKSQFTLIELLVVIAIIGILAGILLPAISSSMNEAKKTRAKSECVQIAMAVAAYQADYGVVTTDFAVLDGGNPRGKKYYVGGNHDNPWGDGQYTIQADDSCSFTSTVTGDTVNAPAEVSTTYTWGGTSGSITSQ